MDSLVSGVRALPQPERVTSVGSVAEALHHIAGAMSDTQVMTVGEGIVGWIGQSAGAFAHEARHIQAAVRKVQGAIANVIAALNEYQSVCNGLTQQIRSHQQNWDSNIAWYKKEVSEIQSRVGAASGGQFPLLDAVDGVEVAKAALRARLDERQADEARAYNKTVEAVDAAAASTAGKLKAALDAVVPGVTGPDGARGVPSRAAVGLALFGGTKGILAAQSRWAAAEADAPAAAELINRIDGKTKLPSQAALRQFNATYGARLASDPYFATMLMREIGAEKLYSLAAKKSYINEKGNNYLLSDAYRKQLKAFTASMGAGLILATGGSSKTDTDTTNGFKALDNTLTTDGKKTIRQWRSDFQAALIANGEKLFDAENGKVVSSDRKGPLDIFRGYELLGQYLGYGAKAHPELSLGDHFLNGIDKKNSVAHAMVDWDCKHPKNYTMTGQMKEVASKSAMGIYKDGMSWDFLQHMYEAMDNAPDKTPSQTFMNSDSSYYWDHDHNSSTPNRAMNMTRYLVGTRGQISKDLYWSDDKGEALGRLINDISHDKTNRMSPNIVREYIKGYIDGLERKHDEIPSHGVDDINGQDIFGYKNSVLRSYTGSILKDYMGDIAHEMNNCTGEVEGPGASWDIRDKRYHLVLDEELLAKLQSTKVKKGNYDSNVFFKDLGFDKKGIKYMSSVSYNEMGNEYYQAYTAFGDSEHKRTIMDNIKNDYSDLLKKLDDGDYEADRSKGEEDSNWKSNVIGVLSYLNEKITDKIPIVGEALQDAADKGLEIIEPKDLDNIDAKHATKDVDRKVIIDKITKKAEQNEIELKGKIQSPIIHRYKLPEGTTELSNIPGIKDYSDQLPPDEKFIDQNGHEISGKNMEHVHKIENAKNRFRNSRWNGLK